MDFTDGICETDQKERKKDRMQFIHVRYLLTVAGFNCLSTWRGEIFSFELVIFGSYGMDLS